VVAYSVGDQAPHAMQPAGFTSGTTSGTLIERKALELSITIATAMANTQPHSLESKPPSRKPVPDRHRMTDAALNRLHRHGVPSPYPAMVGPAERGEAANAVAIGSALGQQLQQLLNQRRRCNEDRTVRTVGELEGGCDGGQGQRGNRNGGGRKSVGRARLRVLFASLWCVKTKMDSTGCGPIFRLMKGNGLESR